MDWLLDAIMGNFANLYDTINQQVGDIATNVGQTPGDWDVCCKG